jgi:hypothetical protein
MNCWTIKPKLNFQSCKLWLWHLWWDYSTSSTATNDLKQCELKFQVLSLNAKFDKDTFCVVLAIYTGTLHRCLKIRSRPYPCYPRTFAQVPGRPHFTNTINSTYSKPSIWMLERAEGTTCQDANGILKAKESNLTGPFLIKGFKVLVDDGDS